jgi:integrase
LAKGSLTQLAVDRIKPPATGRFDRPDGQVPGLFLRVSHTGVKSWRVVYRVKGERRQVPETLGTLTLAEARKRALESKEKARLGINPVAERRAAAAAENAVDAKTFAAVAERFIREHVERTCRPSTIREYRRMIAKDLLPVWGDKSIGTIAKADVNDLLDRKAKRFALQANEVRKHLRTLFRWALDLDLITADPTSGTRPRAKPVARDRVLADREVVLFWHGCEELGWPFAQLFKLLLLTGQRRNEVAGMRWSEIDLAAGIWTIPSERVKTARVHMVHLSSLVLKIIEELPRLGAMVFSTTGATTVSGFSHAKARLDQAIAEANGGPIPDWVLHDLRRTCATGLARLKVSPHVTDRILNHTAGTIRGVAAVYNKFQYEDERRDALEAWGQYIERLVAPPSENVVALAR